MPNTVSRAARKHVMKLVAVGILLFGFLVAIPIGLQNPNGPLGWFLFIGIMMGAAGIFILAAYTDRAIRRQARKFYSDA